MKILFVLTYYRPHVSGLTIYVQRLAEALAARGHRVTVLTSQYDRALPAEEKMDGVRIVRVPVWFRVSKGCIMPRFPLYAHRLIAEHDVVSVHLPQFEASLLGFLGRFVTRRPVILTYHCDLQLPHGLFNRFVDKVVFVSNWVAGQLADRIVAYTRDYAEHSPYLSQFLDKVRVIPPPVHMPSVDPKGRAALCQTYDLNGRVVIGFAARVAAEKGVEYLLSALPLIRERIPNAYLLLAGPYQDVLGENAYFRKLEPLIQANQGHLKFLGVLDPQEMANFFSAIDVLVVSSVNSTESFGLVQVESMLCGTPVVASNLPGVRQPVYMTGMGRVVPIRDPAAIAEAVVEVVQHREKYVRPRQEIEAIFDLEVTLREYEELFAAEMERVGGRA